MRQTEDQLRQAQKMEAVGQLAGGWRTISTTSSPFTGYTDLLMSDWPAGAPMLVE